MSASTRNPNDISKRTLQEASLAYLQTPSKIDGIGGGITTLNVGAAGTKNCTKLIITLNGLVATSKDGVDSLIPWANVKVCTLK